MTFPRGATILAGLLAVAAPLLARTARATEGSCSSLLIEADAAVRDHWPDLPSRVRESFDGRSDVDACAIVRLRYADGSVALEVSLPDGRSASRLTRREDVIAGLEALLLVPEGEVPAGESAPPPTPARTTFEPRAVEARNDGGRLAPGGGAASVPESRPSRFSVELSLGAGMHRGDGQTSEGLGASSLLDASGWLVGFTGRLDRYGADPAGGGDPPKALEVGALGGRRVRLGAFNLDFVGGPALALRGSMGAAVTRVVSQGMASTPPMPAPGQGFTPRLVLGGRLTLGARSIVRTYVGVDGEMGDSGPIPPGSVRGLPLWTVGFTVGATVGTL
jgi:hypothetical protein